MGPSKLLPRGYLVQPGIDGESESEMKKKKKQICVHDVLCNAITLTGILCGVVTAPKTLLQLQRDLRKVARLVNPKRNPVGIAADIGATVIREVEAK